MSEDNAKLPAFRGSSGSETTTFSDWRFKCEAYGLGQGGPIWEFVADPAEPPTKPAPTTEGDLKKYNVLYGKMVSSLHDNALAIAKGLKDKNARELLRVLDKHYKNQGMSSRMLAISQLVSDRQKDNETVDDFIKNKERLYRELLNGSISDKEILLGSVISNLKGCYDDLVSSLVSGDDEVNTTIEVVSARLRDKEKRMGHNGRELGTTRSAALMTDASDYLTKTQL